MEGKPKTEKEGLGEDTREEENNRVVESEGTIDGSDWLVLMNSELRVFVTHNTVERNSAQLPTF